MKIDRLKVYNKYSGHCSYCGKEIEFKDMQIDHAEPLMRETRYNYDLKKLEFTGKYLNPENENFENLLPSCRRCNHYKRGTNIEGFRKIMNGLHERIRKNYICKVAEDFGIIKIEPFDGKFYFEKI